jgi:hypothetical protein
MVFGISLPPHARMDALLAEARRPDVLRAVIRHGVLNPADAQPLPASREILVQNERTTTRPALTLSSRQQQRQQQLGRQHWTPLHICALLLTDSLLFESGQPLAEGVAEVLAELMDPALFEPAPAHQRHGAPLRYVPEIRAIRGAPDKACGALSGGWHFNTDSWGGWELFGSRVRAGGVIATLQDGRQLQKSGMEQLLVTSEAYVLDPDNTCGCVGVLCSGLSQPRLVCVLRRSAGIEHVARHVGHRVRPPCAHACCACAECTLMQEAYCPTAARACMLRMRGAHPNAESVPSDSRARIHTAHTWNAL